MTNGNHCKQYGEMKFMRLMQMHILANRDQEQSLE